MKNQLSETIGVGQGERQAYYTTVYYNILLYTRAQHLTLASGHTTVEFHPSTVKCTMDQADINIKSASRFCKVSGFHIFKTSDSQARFYKKKI